MSEDCKDCQGNVMRMSYDLVTAKDRVEHILSRYPDTRDSDKLLLIAYWCVFHGLKDVLGEEKYLEFKKFILNDAVPTMESLRRVRQKFQENGMYCGEKREMRIEESGVVKEMIRDGII